MVRIKLTEKSYRKDFISRLFKEIEPHGMILFDDPSLSYIDKENNKHRTHFPDIVIALKDKVVVDGDSVSIAKDGVVAAIETKRATKQVYEGFRQATDYMTTLNTNQAFATNFKDVVGIQVVDGKPKIDECLNAKLDETSTLKVINFIVSTITHTTELHPVELSDDLIIKLLEGAVAEILEYMNKIEATKLEQPLGFFFAKQLDTKLIHSAKNKKEFEQAMKRGAAYLVINQIVFYQILSTEDSLAYTPLKEIHSIPELQTYFDKVLQHDYRSIFGAKVVLFLPTHSIEALNSIIRAVDILGLQRIKHDILGKIFHGLIPQALRKRIAAYYTSNAAAQLLAEICVENKDEKVFDPACGSGTLLVAAYRRKKELYSHSSENVHKKILSQLLGGDISIFAAHLAAIHLALQEPLSYTDEVHVILGDFFGLSPKKTVLDWFNQSKRVKKVSAEEIKDSEFNLPFVDLIIMNPPFTRMELLEQSYKKFIEQCFANSENKKYVEGRMGLHALFLLHSDDFLKQGGKIAAVLPASTFYTGYGAGLEDFFLSKYNILFIITSDVETTFSEQSTFKEILLVAEKKKSTINNKKTLFISLKVPLKLNNSRDIAQHIKLLENVDYENDVIRVKAVGLKELLYEKNWMTFIDTSTKLYKKILSMRNTIHAKEVLQDNICEGIRRFPTDFFCLPNSNWKILDEKDRYIFIEHIQTKEKLHIPKKVLVPTIRKPELYNAIRLKSLHYLLTIHPNEKIDADLGRYIVLAEKMDLDKESDTLLKTIKKEKVPWYSYTYLLLKNPKIRGEVFVIDKLRVNTGKLMAHYTSEKVTAGGSFHIISTNSDADAKILTLWYNSTIHLFLFLFRGREIQGGYYRALISDLKNLPILNISTLEKETKQELIRIFSKYADTKFLSFPKQIEQEEKREIDLAILKALGASDPGKLLKEIYKSVYDKIEKLRTELT